VRSRRLALAALAVGAVPLLGQDAATSPSGGGRFSLGAMAVGVLTRAAPGARGIDRTEGYLTQPMLTAEVTAPGRWASARVALNFEGATLDRGELNPGVYGESYVDRRHPHTYVHELVGGVELPIAGARLSVFGGKGFVPFGSDDPMVRPFEKYPTNHHHAQILERALIVGAVRVARALLEGAIFNGDEPQDPRDAPNANRFGDSWAARATFDVSSLVELSASTAWVESPENARKPGLDQSKRSLVARFQREYGIVRYAMIEHARTSESINGRDAFLFTSSLGEVAASLGSTDLALRVERTTRPEEERSGSDYRTVRPVFEFSVLGITRWDVLTLHAGRRTRLGVAVLSPFAEVSWLRPRAVRRPAALDPEEFFRASSLWLLSAGVRLALGTEHRRMGRYGAASPPGSTHH
jgi:hypothetical protein